MHDPPLSHRTARAGERTVTDSCSQDFKFTGKERDSETGNDYFGARFYTSSFGRFMSPDWSAKVEPVPYAKLDNPQSLNLYAYAGNNPESVFDPDGHEPPTNAQGTHIVQNGQCGPYAVCTWKKEVTVFHYHYVTTKNPDGTVTTVETITSATFSTAKGNQGQFLRATTQTVIFGKGRPYLGDASRVQEISFGQAVRAMGPSEMARGVASAFPTREGQFGRAVWSDARAHPGKYAVYGAEAVLTLTPLPEAYAGYEGVKAAIDVGLSAAHLAWDLTH